MPQVPASPKNRITLGAIPVVLLILAILIVPRIIVSGTEPRRDVQFEDEISPRWPSEAQGVIPSQPLERMADVNWKGKFPYAEGKEKTDQTELPVERKGDEVTVDLPLGKITLKLEYDKDGQRAYDVAPEKGCPTFKHGGKKFYRFGHWKVFELVTPPCEKWEFVQLRKGSTRVKYEGEEEKQRSPKAPATADDWLLDGPPPQMAKVSGQNAMLDSPGLYFGYPLDPKLENALVKYDYTCRTWVVCCDPRKLIGYFEWGSKVTVTVKATYEDTAKNVEVKPTKPTWHPADDSADYKSAVKDFDKAVSKDKFPDFCK